MDGTSPSVAEVPVRLEFKKMSDEEAREIAILPAYQTCHRRFQVWVRDSTLKRT
jgi:hypothetical protein